MKLQKTYFAPLGAGLVLGLLSIHLGDHAKFPIIAGSLLIMGFSTKQPSFGILASFLLLVVIQPTPTELGWRELCFVGVLGTTTVSSIWQKRAVLWDDAKRFGLCGLLAGVLLVINGLVAQYHNVSLADWARGVAPFVFLSFSVPVYLECRHDSKLIFGVIASLLIASFLFCWLVVSYYVSEQLWLPNYYVMENGQWLRVNASTVACLTQPVFEFRARVTQLLQQATDVLLPSAYVWGAGMMLWGRRTISIVAGSILLITSMVAIILTFTRSMLLAALMVTGLLVLASFFQKKGGRLVVGIAVLTVGSAFFTIWIFDLFDIYLNRYLLLSQAFDYLAAHLPSIGNSFKEMVESFQQGPGIGESGERRLVPIIKDENVTSRIEEYRIALAMFMDSPLFGQGIGVKHEMAFATGLGDDIRCNVQYIHNWVFYFLMAGGIFGLLAWCAVLFGPAVAAFKQKALAPEIRWPIVATVCLFALYGLFFAVFRLIPYNLVLAALWGGVLGSLAGQVGMPKGDAGCVE